MKKMFNLCSIFFGPRVLGYKINTNTGLVHGGRTVGVVEGRSVAPTPNMRTVAVSGSVTRRRSGSERSAREWTRFVKVRFVIVFPWMGNVKRMAMEFAGSQWIGRGSTIASIFTIESLTTENWLNWFTFHTDRLIKQIKVLSFWIDPNLMYPH